MVMVAMALLALVAVSGAAQADSLLTSPPDQSEEGLLFVGEDINDEIKKEAGQDDVLCVTIKKKTEKIWGPQAKKNQENPGEETAAAYGGKYKPIYVKCSSNKAGSYKYRYTKTLSSRGKSLNAKATVKKGYMDITPIIIREAKKNGLDPIVLKAVIQTESRFNPRAVSCAGARGLCQLMPGTARIMGVRNPFDPEESIKGGARYLGLMKKKFKTLELMLAAYNAGPGTVGRAGGVPNIYQTRHYIWKVKKNMQSW